MKAFPTTFVNSVVSISRTPLKDTDAETIDILAAKGFEVLLGLSEEYAVEIYKMCQEVSIREYCPNDSARRFTGFESTTQWLRKGRAAFLLTKKEEGSNKLIGYGWAGPETTANVPGGKSTFALRIGEQGQGLGLATPFARVILSGATTIYEAEGMWLETWESNAAAVHIYNNLGFNVIKTLPSTRTRANGQEASDNRLFMTRNAN